MSKTPESEKDALPPSLLEWSVRGLSFVAVALLLGYLAYAATQPAIGPNFVMQVEADKMEERRNGWAVPVSITNKGSVAISSVFYQIERTQADGSVGIAKDGMISILGAGETVNTEVWFDTAPDPQQLTLRVDTYAL